MRSALPSAVTRRGIAVHPSAFSCLFSYRVPILAKQDANRKKELESCESCRRRVSRQKNVRTRRHRRRIPLLCAAVGVVCPIPLLSAHGAFFGYCRQKKEQCNIASGSAGAAVFYPSFKDTSAMLQSSFSIDHSHLAPAFRVTMPEIFFFASFTVRREICLSAAARMISSQ